MLGNPFWTNVSLIAFAGATLALIPSLNRPVGSSRLNRLGRILLAIGALTLSYSVFGKYDSRIWGEAAGLLLATFVSWLCLGAVFALRFRALAGLGAPAITFLLLMQSFFAAQPPDPALIDMEPKLLIGIHVLLSVIGQAFVLLAGAIGLLYIYQVRSIRRKRLDLITNDAPGLDRLESWLMIALWAGFIFLTSGLITGAIYTQNFVTENPPALVAKIVWSLAIWVWYLAMLATRHLLGRSTIVLARLSLLGILFLSLSMFGLGFFRSIGVAP